MPDDVGVTGGAESSRGFPPSEPPMDELALHEPPGWPKVVGVISIVWGSFWTLCGGCGLAWLAMMPQFMKGAEQQMGGPMPDVMRPGPLQMAASAIGMLGPILLIVAGIMTASRKPAGRSLHVVYAVFSIVMVIISTVLGIRQQIAIKAWATANSADKWAQQADSPIGMVIMVLMLGVAAAWPVFCLCWFGLAKKRPEQGYSELQVV